METKYSIAFFVLGVIIGLLATPERRVLKNPWFWIGAVCAFVIFLPNLVWLIQHDFPFLELIDNVRRSGRDVVRGPLAFVADQAMILNPVVFPLWLAGLIWLFVGRAGSRYRVLAWAYLALLVMFILLKGKNYYLAPAYPMLFASGGVVFEKLSGPTWKRVKVGYVLAVLLSAMALAPLTSPLFSVETYVRYQDLVGLELMRAENQPIGPLPQYFADEFGWEEMTREVARITIPVTPLSSWVATALAIERISRALKWRAVRSILTLVSMNASISFFAVD